MILVSNSAIQYKKGMISYEVFMTKEMLLFKPAFYNDRNNFPFAIFTRNDSEWKLRSDIEKPLEEQFMKEIKTLKIQ